MKKNEKWSIHSHRFRLLHVTIFLWFTSSAFNFHLEFVSIVFIVLKAEISVQFQVDSIELEDPFIYGFEFVVSANETSLHFGGVQSNNNPYNRL